MPEQCADDRALLAGVLDLALIANSCAGRLVATGKMRVLAAASTERVPSVPVARESGVDFDCVLWAALAVRAGTPDGIVRTLQAELRKTLTSQALRDFVQKQGTPLWLADGKVVAAEVASGLARFREPIVAVAAQMRPVR